MTQRCEVPSARFLRNRPILVIREAIKATRVAAQAIPPEVPRAPMARNKADCPATRARCSGGDVPLTRETLVEGLRTYVAMASCWLDRHPATRDIDADQEQKLKDVVGLLHCAAARQREHAELAVATIFRDDVAIALGAESVLEPRGGVHAAHRKARFPHLPSLVPNTLRSTEVRISQTLDPDPQLDRVFGAVLKGHAMWLLRCDSRPAKVEAWREMSLPFAKQLAGRGLVDRESPLMPMGAATRIVAALTGETGSTTGQDVRDESTAKRFQRGLQNRHPDGESAGWAVADEGTYFGATASREPGHEQYPVLLQRSWSAATFIAGACEADTELAGQIVNSHDEPSFLWHLWPQFARGYAHLFAPHAKTSTHVLDRLHRGQIPVTWPPDAVPPTEADIDRLAESLRDNRPNLFYIWSLVAPDASACTGDPDPGTEPAIAGIGAAAMAMFRSTSMNLQRRFGAGRDAAAEFLPPGWRIAAAALAATLLERLGFWPAGIGQGVVEAGTLPADGRQTPPP